MLQTGYCALKNHFDYIYSNSYDDNGMEQLRYVYSRAFGTKIHRYGIFQTKLRVSNNPITTITTLVGPDNDEIKYGIIPDMGKLHCVSILNEKYKMGINDSNIDEYIMTVYDAMCNVMAVDSLYNVSDNFARYNPYCAFLKVCPFYFTFHHVAYIDANLLDNNRAFEDILEKHICNTEDIPKILESISSNKYSIEFENIYKAMTCNGSVDILV